MKVSKIIGAAVLLAAGAAQAAVITSAGYSAVNSTDDIVADGFDSVVTAVNVFGGADSTVNGVTFTADSYTAGDGGGGIGYSLVNDGTYEAAQSTMTVTGADFLFSTVNLGDTGQFIADAVTGLDADTDYVLEVYLSDEHSSRKSDLYYSIGTESGSIAYTQGSGPATKLQVAFNTEDDTTFNWSIMNDETGGYHTKISGYALYAVPEPATLGMLAAFGGGILFIRRRFMI